MINARTGGKTERATTYAEATGHGIAPVPRDHAAYPYMRDGDGDEGRRRRRVGL